LPGSAIAAIAGDQADCESMIALKDLLARLGSETIDCRQDGAALDPSLRASYVFNSTLAGIERADALLLIGTNPRVEAPLLAQRLRKRWLVNAVQTASVGPQADLTFAHDWLGDRPALLDEIAFARHPFAATLRAAKFPALIVGQGALARPDGARLLGVARRIAEAVGMVREDWNGFNVLHTAASRVGGLDLGFVPGPGGRDVAGILAGATSGEIGAVFLLGADEIDMKALGAAFVVYIGSHGDAGAHRADVILPAAAYTEKTATYVNTEGRVQHTNLAVFPPGEASEDWRIVRALSAELGQTLPYDSLAELRARLVAVNPLFGRPDIVSPAAWGPFGAAGPLDPAPLASAIDSYYQTDPISRSSPTMAACVAAFGGGCHHHHRTGTDA
jgi:NADH-quinone oxidoreductase subunit G